MRSLNLVGESLPSGSPVQVGELVGLIPLDPRHGVFPNLVMTPLMSLLHATRASGLDIAETYRQVQELLDDGTTRRFNAFKKDGEYPTNPEFEILSSTARRLSDMRPAQELWALFGYQTIFGVVRWLLTGEARASKRQIRKFAMRFLASAAGGWIERTMLPRAIPKNMSAQEGYMHRLCTDEDGDGSGVVAMLRNAISENATDPAKSEEILDKLRAFVPLLHNEAYQLTPYGVGQANFMLCENWVLNSGRHPEELYWRAMGRSLLKRMVVTAVPTP